MPKPPPAPVVPAFFWPLGARLPSWRCRVFAAVCGAAGVRVLQWQHRALGIGLDEDTAIVVQGDAFEVIGQSYVAIYDHERMVDSGGRFYFLGAGDQYDLKTRRPFRLQRVLRPLERVVERPWR